MFLQALTHKKLDKATIRERYTLPKIRDICVYLAGSAVHTRFDAQSGLHQIAIDAKSSKLKTFLTPFSRSRYKRSRLTSHLPHNCLTKP